MSEQPPYVVGVAFRRAARAKAIYAQVEALLEHQPVDLSAYNLFLDGRPLVIVLGYPPPPRVHEAIGRILASGQPVSVPEPVLASLFQRSLSQWAQSPWSAHHHEPGQVLKVEEE